MLRAVIFDFGQVLSGPPAPHAVEAVMRLLSLDRKTFDRLYWARRSDYDAGRLSGEVYWRAIVREAGRAANDALLTELLRLDGRIWMDENQPMLAWQRALHQTGLRTAILSNMGDRVQQELERECAWVHTFDVCIWSNQHRRIKPDPEIYRTALDRLQVAAEEVLFIDDREENVRAAIALGMEGVVYDSMEKLRLDLKGRELPQP